MARAKGLRRGEVREFRWVGHALQADSVLLDGVARYVRLEEIDVPRPDGSRLRVRHDAFEETVTDLRSGRSGKAFFNNWLGAVYKLTHRDRGKVFDDGVDPEDPLGLLKRGDAP